jgi:hypothetical protein
MASPLPSRVQASDRSSRYGGAYSWRHQALRRPRHGPRPRFPPRDANSATRRCDGRPGAAIMVTGSGRLTNYWASPLEKKRQSPARNAGPPTPSVLHSNRASVIRKREPPRQALVRHRPRAARSRAPISKCGRFGKEVNRGEVSTSGRNEALAQLRRRSTTAAFDERGYMSAANFARAPHCGHQRSVNHQSRSGRIARIAASIHQG